MNIIDNINECLRESYITKLYSELHDKYKVAISFEPRYPSSEEVAGNMFIPGDTIYNNEIWTIRILDLQLVKFNMERVLAHELLHILLRYRNNLPWIEQKMASRMQAIVADEIDHRLINPELDRVYGNRGNTKRSKETTKIIKIITPYLDNAYIGIDKNQYVEIFQKCMQSLNEKMPLFVM